MQSVQEKYKNLQEYLKSLGSVAVAFSSGVDSTFLLAAAKKTLGADHVIAVTASSCSFPKRELEEAKQFCKEQGIRHIVCKSEELDIEGFRQNPKNRCYLCKHELFEKILEIAKEYHIILFLICHCDLLKIMKRILMFLHTEYNVQRQKELSI